MRRVGKGKTAWYNNGPGARASAPDGWRIQQETRMKRLLHYASGALVAGLFGGAGVVLICKYSFGRLPGLEVPVGMSACCSASLMASWKWGGAFARVGVGVTLMLVAFFGIFVGFGLAVPEWLDVLR